MPMSQQYMEQWIDDARGMNASDIEQIVNHIASVYSVNDIAELVLTLSKVRDKLRFKLGVITRRD